MADTGEKCESAQTNTDHLALAKDIKLASAHIIQLVQQE
jgi:hypothetical protein